VALDNNLRDEAFAILKALISLHPVYGSNQQLSAQMLLAESMKRACFDHVWIDSFQAAQIKDHPLYVPVAEFGPIFANYEHLQRHNLVGIVKAHEPGPTLIMNGHVDVDMVYDEEKWSDREGWFRPRIVKGRLMGRGSTDMLGGLTGQLAVASWLAGHRDKWKGTVIVTSVVDEEIGGNGTLSALMNLQKMGWLNTNRPLECIIGEPTENCACITSLGFLHFKLKASRNPIHMGMAQRENNALWDMIQVVSALEKDFIRSLDGGQGDLLRFNIGCVSGGQDAAVPIGECHAEGTIFFPPHMSDAMIADQLRNFIARINPVTRIEFSSFHFAGSHAEKSIMLESIGATSASPGCRHRSIFPSPCDARLFSEFRIPAIVFGPGRLRDAHSVDEGLHLADWNHYVDGLLQAAIHYLSQ
jgi:acetylornithine deacetylase